MKSSNPAPPLPFEEMISCAYELNPITDSDQSCVIHKDVMASVSNECHGNTITKCSNNDDKETIAMHMVNENDTVNLNDVNLKY